MLTLRVQPLEFTVRETASDAVVALARAVIWYSKQAICAIWRGHEMVRHFEPGRLSLRCLHCGVESPGWTIGIEGRHRRIHPVAVPIDAHNRWRARDRHTFSQYLALPHLPAERSVITHRGVR